MSVFVSFISVLGSTFPTNTKNNKQFLPLNKLCRYKGKEQGNRMLWNLNQVKDMCTKNSLPYFTLSFTNFNISNVLLIIKSNPSYQNKPNNTTNTLTHKPNPHPPPNPNKHYYHHNKFNESRHNQNLKTNFNETLKKKNPKF